MGNGEIEKLKLRNEALFRALIEAREGIKSLTGQNGMSPHHHRLIQDLFLAIEMERFARSEDMENKERDMQKKDYRICLFSASFCAPCQAMKPIFNAVAAQYPYVRVEILDCEENSALTERLAIRAVPSLILFREEEEVERLVGNQSEAAIRKLFERCDS